MLPDVGDVQERRALEADLDERRLHAGQHARDAAEIDVADEAARRDCARRAAPARRPLDHRDARFLRGDVDQDVFHGWASMVSQPLGRTLLPALEFRAA